jgi:hypothetical protein
MRAKSTATSFSGLGGGSWILAQDEMQAKLVELFDLAVTLFDKLNEEDKWRSVHGKELRFNNLGGSPNRSHKVSGNASLVMVNTIQT